MEGLASGMCKDLAFGLNFSRVWGSSSKFLKRAREKARMPELHCRAGFGKPDKGSRESKENNIPTGLCPAFRYRECTKTLNRSRRIESPAFFPVTLHKGIAFAVIRSFFRWSWNRGAIYIGIIVLCLQYNIQVPSNTAIFKAGPRNPISEPSWNAGRLVKSESRDTLI